MTRRVLAVLSGAWTLWFAVNVAAQPAASRNSSASLRVLILSDGEVNEAARPATFLRQLLFESGRFDPRLCESPAGLTASTFAPFDVVVVACSAVALQDETTKALETFVTSGMGLVVLRDAPAWSNASARWAQLTGVSRGPVRPVVEPFRLFKLKDVSAQHPVMAGWNRDWHTGDQPPPGLILGPETTALAKSDLEEPVLFATSHGKGRVFGTTLGCNLGSMQEKVFVTSFLRGVEWAASSEVTLPVELKLPEPVTNGLRVLVVTGGHDHEAAFYSLFTGYNDIGWAPVTDSTLAFKQDLRAKYDVVVFYDFTRDLDDKGKKNLRDFVESGKGIVVLHHGVLNFQKWPWWYEEVVGGLYRLESKNGIPNSTVKFGEEHWITAAGPHPITDGITPFHVRDETYKGLFISTNIQPLLLTDNTASDRTVAWVGPCKTSKVVFIQLGHDHSPFRHPSYRGLVHNSILWTAGKLK